MKDKKRKIFLFLFAGIFVFAISSLWLGQKNRKTVNIFSLPESAATRGLEIRQKGCIACHGNMSGLSPSHQEIGCITCHKGLLAALEKDSAHAGMVKVPGNFADMETTCGLCHPDAVRNLQSSLMTTNNGLVNVDRFVFGEQDSPDGHADIRDIGFTAADKHLRDLCARCHLGKEKAGAGPVTQLSRGGGCNACHLNYSPEAAMELKNYRKTGKLPGVHPSLDLNIGNEHCFGCHSRSGRIATNYEGFHETRLHPDSLLSIGGFRILEDGRVFQYVQEDVHHARGLACIDCHIYDEVMGDGKSYFHEEEAIRISCNDCHFSGQTTTITYDSLNFIYKRIAALRGTDNPDVQMIKTRKDGKPLVNAFVDNASGKPYLTGKLNGRKYALTPPAEICTRGTVHDNLSCSACHTAWAPQCIGCHVEFEPGSPGYDLLEDKRTKGTWREYAGGFLAGLPALGVSEKDGKKTVKPAIPSMIMTLDKSAFEQTHGDPEFFRLFAPAAPHTTVKKGRACHSCHNNPVALGYGKGKLELVTEYSRTFWTFDPEYVNSDRDGLPQDAWIGFLQSRQGIVSTRNNFRPFSIGEQQRILTVGACLTCHKPDSEIMLNSLDNDFSVYLLKRSTQCKVPALLPN